MKKTLISFILAAGLILGCTACTQKQDATVSYTVNDASVNGAGGTLEITQTKAYENLYSYEICWGNEQSAFENYTAIGSVSANKTGEKISFTLPSAVAIPQEATHVWAVGYSRDKQKLTASSAQIPAEAKVTSTKLYEFQVFSDYQIQSTEDYHDYNLNALAAFTDAKTISPNTSAIINNGDIVEFDKSSYYDTFFSIVDSVYGETKPSMYFTVGNHEFTKPTNQPGDYATDLALWNSYTASYNGTNDVYFYQIINGSYFIFLGSVTSPAQRSIGYVDAVLGEEQLNWLEGVLEEAGKTGKPIYTFLHQSLQDTVSGSLTELFQEWYGVTAEGENERLQSLLDKYPQLLHFTSHSHWHLQSEGAWKYGNGEKANYFNTASVGYLWQGEGGGSGYAGSEGLYVEVYEDYVLVRGRSFDADKPENSKWISNAQFIVPLK